MMNRTVLYLRVSTQEQTTENQRRELEALASLKGWNLTGTYEDAGYSGSKGRDKRPELDRLLKDAAKRRFDRVLFWAVDRLGRSTAQVTTTMDELDDHGIEQFFFKESIDTSTAHGKAMLEMAAVFAKLERSMIQERVKAGLERAKAEGTKLGRPGMDEGKVSKVKALLTDGLSVRKVSGEAGVSVGYVHKVKKAMVA